MKLFQLMVKHPWPFMTVIPAIMIALTVVGWTREDIIEDSVNDIWIPTKGAFAQDKAYLAKVGRENATSTTFLAVSKSRDDGNLFTANRLEEIRARMEATESTTITYNGETFTWDDFCISNNLGLNTAYQFPCFRLSPLDLFQEARWFFGEDDRVTWYNGIHDNLVRPRLPRFGIMQNTCSSQGGKGVTVCDHHLALRNNATYAMENGYPADYANPLALFSDIGNFENNEPCKICIEEGYEETLKLLTSLTKSAFSVLFLELKRLFDSGTVSDASEVARLELLLQQVGEIAQSIDRPAVESFYAYYVTRSLYAALGASSYVRNYAAFMKSLGAACLVATGNATLCPANVTQQEATEALLGHADNRFSSLSTAGAPFPFWDEAGAALFSGTFPVGGSGVDMSGTVLAMTVYLNLENYATSSWRPLSSDGTGIYVNPFTNDTLWNLLVETDPVYRWFIAGVTPMTSHCSNGNLTGTMTGIEALDGPTGVGLATLVTQRWCTVYNDPYEVDGTFTQQHFARMWYDLLIDSPSFLGIVQGQSDPYVWTTGQGCGYTLKGVRNPYTSQNEVDILQKASRELYYVDEGVSAGAIDRNLLIGDAVPAVGEYSQENPLTHVGVIQTLYIALVPAGIMARVRNCNRPGGALELSFLEAKELLEAWKIAMEKSWVEGWDDSNNGEVQFVGFSDDQGSIGTTAQLLIDITLSNGRLTAISIIIIAVFSAIFLFSCDAIESKVLVTTVGVGLVLLSFFAALGLGILLGIDINVNIAWTLPFIILGLGVDDMYIIILILKKRANYSDEAFVSAMKEAIVPVTMTSFVNAAMFAVMNMVDVPAVYLTAQMALIAIIFLYITAIFAFPAYCYLDMKRQQTGRYDVAICFKKVDTSEDDKQKTPSSSHHMNSFIYDFGYKPMVLSENLICRRISHALIWLGAAAIFGVGIYGITERKVGLGLEDFFPQSHQAHTWATIRTEDLAAWPIQINWGELSYKEPVTQMKMIKQFEDVVATPHVAESDTAKLWLASFNIWTTRQCTANFGREDPDTLACGQDQAFPVDNSTCSGSWTENTLGLKLKSFAEECQAFDGGICRPTSQMHFEDLLDLGIDPRNPGDALDKTWCPVFSGWTDDKFQFCLGRWRNATGGAGDLVVHEGTATPNPSCSAEFYRDDRVVVPVPFSAGPTMYAYGLNTHEDTLDLIRQTRAVCDNAADIHCFMSGIPYNYWEQYLKVEEILVYLGGTSIGIGFAVSVLFLFCKLSFENNHPTRMIFFGSVLGALLIALTTLLCFVTVIGLSVLAGVNLTAFSDMSFVLSVGFAVEYAVHVVHRVIKAPMHLVSAFERVEHTMSFLALPTFMSFVSSTIGVVCLAFTNFDFNTVFFFRPLIITMAVTYFYGCWLLPVFLCGLNFECLKLGKNLGVEFSPEEEPDIVELKAVAEQPLKEMEHDDEEHFA